MLTKIIDYMPSKSYLKLTNKLIENFDIIDKIPNTNKISQIYISSINYFMDSILEMKKNILYDINNYSDHKTKILKLLVKCPNEINLNQNYCLDWLTICIKNNEYEMFKTILSKYFFNEKNICTSKYLNKIIPNENEPIIITAIKEEKILFVKNLLNYDIDLSVSDKMNRNAIIVVLETKNLDMIRLIRNHIINTSSYNGMVQIMDTFIDLLDRHETFNTFSIHDTIFRLWKSTEYMINYFLISTHDTNK
jgi:hypothetical protein